MGDVSGWLVWCLFVCLFVCLFGDGDGDGVRVGAVDG